MNDQLIINNKVDEREIHKILKMVEAAFENGKTHEVLNILIPFQKKYAMCFSVDELGLLRLTKSSCVDLADTYMNSGLHNQAKYIYEFVLKYFPEDNDVYQKYSASLLANVEEKINNLKYDEARALLKEIIEKNKKDVSAMIDLGVLDVLEQKYKDAKIIFQNVLEIEPGNDVALENLQFVLQTEKEK